MGYTQRQLADLVQIDYTYLSKIENDKADYIPKEEVIRKLASWLETESEPLIFLAGKIPVKYSELLSKLALKHGNDLPKLLEKLLTD